MNVSSKLGPGKDRMRPVGGLTDCPICGVIVVDGKRKIRACTDGAGYITGLPVAQLVAEGSALLPTALRRMVTRVSRSRKPLEDQLVHFDSADGHKKSVHVSALPLESGKAPAGVTLLLQDASPAQRFHENIRRLDRLASLGTLSTGMAHEIKNALVSVKTFIDLLLEKNRDAELAEVVHREMRRISSLVSQTLKFAGPARPAFSGINLHDLLDHSLRMVQPQMDKKIIALHRAFNAEPDHVRGDDYQLEQVFVNLLLNAVEAMGSSGSLTVATELISPAPENGSSQIRVTISDTGVGIKGDNMGRLFEPFFTTKENGTGLGLAIARRIVEEHHGAIQAESEVNKGTTFSVLLPANSPAN